MYSAGIIVFREILEIALILGVLLAATRGLAGRNHYIGLGIAGGVIGSALLAFFTETIAGMAEGMGQEIFNAAILLVATSMIAWTVIWMRKHGKAITDHLKHVGTSVSRGDLPMMSLTIVVFLAILREGSEIVLFTFGQLARGDALSDILLGSAGGFIAGSIVGFLLYKGLLQISPRRLFSVTSTLLMLLAAGMAAQAASMLSAAGLLPELISPVWDTSSLLSEQSTLGQLLHVLIGYTDRPTGMQLIFYGVTLGIILLSMRVIAKRQTPKPQTV